MNESMPQAMRLRILLLINHLEFIEDRKLGHNSSPRSRRSATTWETICICMSHPAQLFPVLTVLMPLYPGTKELSRGVTGRGAEEAQRQVGKPSSLVD